MNRPGYRRHHKDCLQDRRTGLARALSKLGFCSRSRAREFIQGGRVRVNGRVRLDPEWRVDLRRDRFEVDGQAVGPEAKVYLMLNKPRGWVTTVSDEKGRSTVCDCLSGQGLPFVAPVGRLDKASEGLLLLTNDTQWAARLTDPAAHLDKLYHVQVDCLADERLTRRASRPAPRSRAIFWRPNASGSSGTAPGPVGWRSCSTKARTGRFAACSPRWTSKCSVWSAWPSARCPLGNLPKGAFRHLTAEEAGRL